MDNETINLFSKKAMVLNLNVGAGPFNKYFWKYKDLIEILHAIKDKKTRIEIYSMEFYQYDGLNEYPRSKWFYDWLLKKEEDPSTSIENAILYLEKKVITYKDFDESLIVDIMIRGVDWDQV